MIEVQAGGTVPNDALFTCEIDGKKYYSTAKTETTTDGKTVITATDFKNEDVTVGDATVNLGNATSITLLKSFTAPQTSDIAADKAPTPGLTLSNSCTLDLNGKTLTFNTAIGIQVANGTSTTDNTDPENPVTTITKNTFILTDSGTGGEIVGNWDSSTGTTPECSKDSNTNASEIKKNKSNKLYAAINVGTPYGKFNQSDIVPNTCTEFVMQGGTINSQGSAICGSLGSTISITDGCTVKSEKACAVYFGHQCAKTANSTAASNTGTVQAGTVGGTLNMTGGTLTSGTSSEQPTIQVSGNLSAITTTINISGGTVEYTKAYENIEKDSTTHTPEGDPTAIYASGNTKLSISGNAKVTSTGTGIEFRAGELEVTGGTIESTAQGYAVAEGKGSGSTTFGSAIAIAQHTTKKTIDVKISGDNTNISGINALAIANPAGNANGVNNAVTATIDGGNFTSKTPTDTTVNQTGSQRANNAILADKANVVLTVNNGKLNGNVTVVKTTTTTKTGEGETTETNDNVQQATVVINGGTTSGTVQVVKNVVTIDKTGTTESTSSDESVIDPEDESTDATDKTAATSALKVTGGKITDKSSASKYTTPGTEVSDDGTVTEIAGANGWSLQSGETTDKYAYYIGKGAESIITASISGSDAVTNNILRYDKTNSLLGIPTLAAGQTKNYDWASADAQNMYRLAMYNTADGGKAVTIAPQTSNVKISGKGFIDSNVITLTAATTEEASLGVEVDATENSLANIKGSFGKDKFIAGERNTTLDGGDGDDTLEGNSGIDLFLYSKGQDQINNYTYDSDIVSLNGANLAPPVDFNSASYDGTNLKLTFEPNNVLTFKGAAKVALLKTANNVTDTYTYDARSAGVWNYIAHEGNGISLGAGYTGTQYPGQNEDYATIDASNVTRAIRIRGNDDGNYIVGSKLGGVLEGNDGNDSLYGSGAGTTASLTVNGGAGNDLMFGGTGYNNFVYSEGKDTISGYHDKDLINVTGRNVSFADVTVSTPESTSDLLIKFDDDNQLSIAGGATLGSPISIKSGRNNYAFTKNYFALNGKSITLTSSYDDGKNPNYKTYDGANESYETINAGLVEGAISIVGNANNNYIVGGTQGNSLAGGDGDDTLVGGTAQANLFYYTKGKDVIENFRTGDKLAIDADLVGDIKSGKLTNSKLTFTINKKSDDLTFRFGDNDPFGKVSLNGSNAYLTKDGVASIKSGTDYSLDLFASAKGRIDLTDTLYSGESIKAVDAGEVKNQTVTLVGGKQGGTFTYAENKKKDGFEYGGGNVTISGYEGGRDRIDLNGVASLRSFTADTDGVKLTLGDSNTISIAGAKDKEVLLRDTSRGYKKMVFTADGVVQNKKNNPTMATVSTGAGNNYSAGATIKKIFVTDVSAGTSIQAGKNNTIIDASAAGHGVSLSGGAKNDKLIGSSYGDLFIYGAGKDVVQGFGTSDSISLSDEQSAKLKSAKITASKKSIKFKFGNKDVLTIKSNDTMSGALNINGEDKIYFKNAIGSGVRTSLTSEFSGTFRTQDSKRTLSEVTYVDGSKVKKNLTFSGSSEGETLIGSDSNKKTMFKGGGGADSLVGGDSKDTFFYAKGNTGDATIAKFDFANDKIKVSSGIISKIEKSGDSAIKFSMTNGKSTDAAVGSFTITSKGDGKSFDASKVAIKANNTYYWFTESGSDTTKYYSASTGEEIGAGTLITTENRLKNAPSGGYVVIDLNYSTNLAKNDIVAVKATTNKPTTTTT